MAQEIPDLQVGFEYKKAPDTVPDWLVYEEFAKLSDLSEVSFCDEVGNDTVVRVHSKLLDNRVLHTNYPEGSYDRSWHVTVLELADARKTRTTITEWPEGVKRENYVYYHDHHNFAVIMTDGLQIHYLPIENATSQHVGVVDMRGITGEYRPENETIAITAFLDGLRCTIKCNKVSGDGVVGFRQIDGSLLESWILSTEESSNIQKQSTHAAGLRHSMGRWVTDSLNAA
jgi:hypothetical protein